MAHVAHNTDSVKKPSKTASKVTKKNVSAVSTTTIALADPTPTTEAYPELSDAYRFFNDEIFEGKLPHCMINMARKSHKTRAYYWDRRFVKGDTVVGEISLNPDFFRLRTDRETLSTLVHEMVHCWQYNFGVPSRNGYHNKEWASAMGSVGLMPTDTGLPGGKLTGQNVTHYIVEGGRFDLACAKLLATGYKISWASFPVQKKDGRGGKREKYICPQCALQMEGRFDAHVICGDCNITMPGSSACTAVLP
jgi:predicted SprT family Zn-dependent metalloprotease